jgi:hypothetical protein
MDRHQIFSIATLFQREPKGVHPFRVDMMRWRGLASHAKNHIRDAGISLSEGMAYLG